MLINYMSGWSTGTIVTVCTAAAIWLVSTGAMLGLWVVWNWKVIERRIAHRIARACEFLEALTVEAEERECPAWADQKLWIESSLANSRARIPELTFLGRKL